MIFFTLTRIVHPFLLHRMPHVQDLAALAGTLGIAVYLYGQCRSSSSSTLPCRPLLLASCLCLLALASRQARLDRSLVGTWWAVHPLTSAMLCLVIASVLAAALRRGGRTRAPA